MIRRDFLKLAAAAVGAPVLAPRLIAAPREATRVVEGGVKPFGDARDWFFERRFGMFVHWGLYSIAGWHEQDQWRRKIPRREYVKLAGQWNPTKFDPERWLDLMEEGGMKYVCLTTKHHDGFCLWDTKQTEFNTMNTPYGKDIVGMLAEACHKRKLPLCLYYSIADWNQSNYPNQGRHHELPPQAGDQPGWAKYLEFLKAQVRELCTNYGTIHGFWWDMNVPKHVDPSINAMIRKLQPAAVINNRGFDDGDFGTPERDYEKDDAAGFERLTEACQSVGMESWGYRKEEDYYSDLHLIRSIDRYLARGANYLLNVGPDATGVIPEGAAAIVRRIGAWYKSVKESLEGVSPMPRFVDAPTVFCTRREQTLYVHLNGGPVGDAIKLKPIRVAPKKATLLNTGAPVECAVAVVPSEHVSGDAFLRLRGLPTNAMTGTVMVVKLEFDRPIESVATSVKAARSDDPSVR